MAEYGTNESIQLKQYAEFDSLKFVPRNPYWLGNGLSNGSSENDSAIRRP